MTQLAFCPTCGVPWGNFCPQDGTRLTGAWTCPNAPKPISMAGGAPAPAAAPTPTPTPAAPTPAPVAAASAAASEPNSAARTKANRRSPDEVKTVLEMPAVTVPPAATAGGERDGRKRLGSALLDSVAGPSRAEGPARERVPVQQAETAVRPGAERAEAAAKKAPGGRRRQGFSETQWFMMGVQADADTLEAVAEPTAYEHDETIPEEQRRQFSLRRDDD